MFYIVVLFTVLLIINLIMLWKNKLPKKTIKIAFVSFIFLLFNYIILIPSIKEKYSSTIYLLDLLVNKPFLVIIWIILTILYMYYFYKTTKYLMKKKKINHSMAVINNMFLWLMMFYFIFLLFHNQFAWILLFLLIGLGALLIKNFWDERKNYNLIFICLLAVFIYYSYFTYQGAAKLNIALMGYPIKAYQTGLEELKYLKEDNVVKFYPLKTIIMPDGDMGLIEVKNHLGIKIAKYKGF